MTDDEPLSLDKDDPPAAWLGASLLAAITTVAVVLRWPYLHESLWLDELHTSWTIIDGWGPILERAEIGNYSPLYFWLVRAVTEVVGHHEWSLRLPSLLAGTALVSAVGLVTWRWTGSLPAGLLAAWMAALDELCILFSVEARPYALVALLATLHVGISAELVQQPTPARRAEWVLLACVLVYLHYTAALLLFAEAAWYLVLGLWRRMWPMYGVYYALIDAAILLLLCLPALLHLVSISGHRVEWEQFVVRPGIAELFVMLPVARDLVVPFVVVGGWATISTLRSEELVADSMPVPIWLPLATAWLIVPLLVAWMLSINDVARLYFPRYVFLAAPALFVLAAGFFARLPAGSSRTWYCGLIVLATLFISPSFPFESFGGPLIAWRNEGAIVRHATQDWRSAIAVIADDREHAGWPVLVEAGLIERSRLATDHRPLAQEYLSLLMRGIYSVKGNDAYIFPMAILTTPLDAKSDQGFAFHEAFQRPGGLRLLLSGDERQTAELLETAPFALRSLGLRLRVARTQQFEGVTLAWLEKESP